MDKYQTPITISRQSDFFEKWDAWQAEVKALSKGIELIAVTNTAYGYTKEFYFAGVADTKVYGCLFFNQTKTAKKESVVLYHGLGAVVATEGYQQIAKYWLDEGYSVLGMDSRLQGGKTIDPNQYQFREYGLTAFNILDPENYYSKRLFQDALQLLEITVSLPEIENFPLYVTGGSKGGELSLLASSLSDKVKLCLCDIPSGCYLEGRIKGSHGAYRELNKFIADHPELAEQVYKTVSYFDLVNFSFQISCPVLASVGSEDTNCPPDFFYQAYRQIPAPKVFINYEGYGHGGYDPIHMPKKFAFIETYRPKE
ncbi:MAG TPA: acetylxylan esterase [Bacilli bacterium]|nr:acetylxylan esterase [Bacilli bacterium]HPK57888.1 acetylxylan esterase [Bacilli bacterium]